VVYLARRDLLEEDGARLERVRSRITRGPKVRALLSGQRPGGGFGVHPYRKWIGSHWRLVSLVELAIPRDNRKAHRAAAEVLAWLSDALRHQIPMANRLPRKHASVYGNPLGAFSYLGLAEDQRVRLIADSLLEWQWPDGGWNCDPRPGAHHSSFYESLATLWGLAMYRKETGDRRLSEPIKKASELFLSHHLFRSHRTGEVADPAWLKLHYPVYWHYDILQALRVLSLCGAVNDPRASEALDTISSKRTKEGLWRAEGFYWHPVRGRSSSSADVVDWGRKGPNEMITLNALRVLKAAKRVD
jgi:hypothetical protein